MYGNKVRLGRNAVGDIFVACQDDLYDSGVLSKFSLRGRAFRVLHRTSVILTVAPNFEPDE
jgi:hypothetical protein